MTIHKEKFTIFGVTMPRLVAMVVGAVLIVIVVSWMFG